MLDLSVRQVRILRAIIEEFINSGQPVGSDTLDKKYNIGVSPATIRNEMAALDKKGYLYKPHASAGRIPTHIAFRLYINELMKTKDLSIADEVSAKEMIWKSRENLMDILIQSSELLSQKASALGFGFADNNRVFHSGYHRLLDKPELFKLNTIKNIFRIIEDHDLLYEILNKNESVNPVRFVFGSEFGDESLDQVVFIFFNTHIRNKECYIGTVGSNRVDYSYVVPLMKFLKSIVEELQ